jgi:hypothetical protein
MSSRNRKCMGRGKLICYRPSGKILRKDLRAMAKAEEEAKVKGGRVAKL